MSTTSETPRAPVGLSNASILLLSAALFALILVIHPVWNAAILKAATDGLESSQGWFTIARHIGHWGLLLMAAPIAVMGAVMARGGAPLFLLPATLAVGLLITPMWASGFPDSSHTRSTILERLIEIRKQGNPSSAEPTLLKALKTRDEAVISSAFFALPPAATQRLIQLQSSMGMDSQAVKAKGFAERSDVDAAVDFSRTHNSPKEVQQELYTLLSWTAAN